MEEMCEIDILENFRDEIGSKNKIVIYSFPVKDINIKSQLSLLD